MRKELHNGNSISVLTNKGNLWMWIESSNAAFSAIIDLHAHEIDWLCEALQKQKKEMESQE